MSRLLVPSSISWIGNIPNTWKIIPNKRVMHKVKKICTNYNGEDILSLSMSGVIKRDLDNPMGKMPETFDGYQYIKKDNLIMCLFDMDVTPRCIGLSNYNGLTSPAYTQFELFNKKYNRYYYYYYLYLDNSKALLHLSKNLRSSLTDSQLGEIHVPLPPEDEAIRIADYLDSKCDILDKIISDNNKEIELLEEYKKTLITETITTGLNANVNYKDSGISWMGKIPNHYSVISLKRLGTARNGLSYNPEDISDDGILVLRSSNIQNNKLSLDDNVYVNKNINESLILKENDLLICSRNGSKSLIGKNILIDKRVAGQTFGAFMCIFRSKYNKYIRYVLNSHIFDYYLANFLTSTINQLTTSNLYSIKIPFTYDEKEQKQIIDYLDNHCLKIDEVIEYRKSIIDKIEKYKKSLIYEVVTGKKEV